jgi:hypothetical protein
MGNRASRRLEARLDEMDKRIELIGQVMVERWPLSRAHVGASLDHDPCESLNSALPAKTLRDALEDAWGKPVTSTFEVIDALGALIGLAQHEEVPCLRHASSRDLRSLCALDT